MIDYLTSCSSNSVQFEVKIEHSSNNADGKINPAYFIE